MLDDSINSNETMSADCPLQESIHESMHEKSKDKSIAVESVEEGEIQPAMEVISSQDSSEEKEPESVSDIDENDEEGRIWSPIRIARLVRRIRAVGRGRIEEVTYRLLFGFNKDNGKLMCKTDHRKCNEECTY